ncbi:hypothetical protein ACIP5N_21395 [Streptomyces sp. NPDC088768]|uniref:hypothetical protein n=1 Tax=Streptomyces sp. NPDC088768 TaxID=3365894 RepID=UPI00382187D1
MDWLSPVSGLVGALVGAAASYLGTHKAQAKALEDAKQARLEAKQDVAVAVLADTFGQLQRHVRHLPQAREPFLNRAQSEQLAAVRQAWDQELEDLIAPARIAVETIRDEELRALLHEAMELLGEWQSGLEYAYYGRSRSWVLSGVISHAVACVGAWQREERLPEPGFAFREARSSLEQKREEWQHAHEAEEEHRREQRAQREATRAEPPSTTPES